MSLVSTGEEVTAAHFNSLKDQINDLYYWNDASHVLATYLGSNQTNADYVNVAMGWGNPALSGAATPGHVQEIDADHYNGVGARYNIGTTLTGQSEPIRSEVTENITVILDGSDDNLTDPKPVHNDPLQDGLTILGGESSRLFNYLDRSNSSSGAVENVWAQHSGDWGEIYFPSNVDYGQTLTAELKISWASFNEARMFWNQGGAIRISVAQSAGNTGNTSGNTWWQHLFTDIGEVEIGLVNNGYGGVHWTGTGNTAAANKHGYKKDDSPTTSEITDQPDTTLWEKRHIYDLPNPTETKLFKSEQLTTIYGGGQDPNLTAGGHIIIYGRTEMTSANWYFKVVLDTTEQGNYLNGDYRFKFGYYQPNTSALTLGGITPTWDNGTLGTWSISTKTGGSGTWTSG
jgi:hypothetical protein